ncbi:MAG: hypothetical protein Kow0025_09200 [Thermodesulfovibrionales bacterium]
MVVEESVVIDAKMEKVWDTFTDLSCWRDWVRAAEVEAGEGERIEEGKTLKLCFRPFSFPVHIEPRVEEVAPHRRVVWSGQKYGVASRHEFVFEQTPKGVRLTSRETFEGPADGAWRAVFPEGKVRQITASILRDIKEAAEF